MKSIFTMLFLLAFAAIAMFGFVAMHPGENHTSGCIAAEILGSMGCPKESAATIPSLAFHIEAFKSFSTATLLLLGTLLFAIAFLLKLGKRFALPIVLISSLSKRLFTPFVSPLEQRKVRWLALHINSPAIL